MLRSPDATLRLRHETDPSDQRRVSARVFRPFRSWVSARVWPTFGSRRTGPGCGALRCYEGSPLPMASRGGAHLLMPSLGKTWSSCRTRPVARSRGIQVSGSVPGSLGPWVPHAGDDTDRALVPYSAPSEWSPSADLVPLAPLVASEPAWGRASRVLSLRLARADRRLRWGSLIGVRAGWVRPHALPAGLQVDRADLLLGEMGPDLVPDLVGDTLRTVPQPSGGQHLAYEKTSPAPGRLSRRVTGQVDGAGCCVRGNLAALVATVLPSGRCQCDHVPDIPEGRITCSLRL